MRGACAVPPGSCVLVAVSGGADSTALLLALHNLCHEFGVALAAAHLDHGLRGSDSSADRVFVRGLCARLGVPLTDAHWNTHARMERRGLTGQNGLRTLRREFLLDAALRHDAAAIATAHTADDQVETVLLRLGRGTGLHGFGAMPARRGRWIRPLLDVPRADIEADLTRIGQRWREDASNASLDYTRNRIRHLVVPTLLEALEPGSGGRAHARAALARRVVTGLGEVRAAHRLLERRARRTVRRLASIQDGEIRLDSVEWRSYPAVIQRLALRAVWARLAGGRAGLTSRHLTQLAGLMRPGRVGARAELPLGARAVRDPRGVTLRLAPNSMRTSTSAARSIAR
jgi:tRNA(Ile)-lysidine synthase